MSDVERVDVNQFKEKMRKLRNFELSTSSSNRANNQKKNDEQKAFRDNQMKDLMSLMRTHAVDKRCFMELSFLRTDRRHLGIVDEDSFWKVLHDFGLSQILNDTEKNILMTRYKKTTPVKAISATGILLRQAVHYRKFCRDLLTPELLISKDDQAWKSEKAPQISASTKALDTYVRTVQTQKLFDETETKKKIMLSAKFETSNVFDTGRDRTSESGLDHWETCELSKIIRTVEIKIPELPASSNVSDISKNLSVSSASSASSSSLSRGDDGRKKSLKLTAEEVRLNNIKIESLVQDPNFFMLSRQQCEHVFKCMINFKKVPELGVEHSMNILFRNIPENDINSGIKSTIFRASLGCPQRAFLPLASSSTPVRSLVSAPRVRKGVIPKNNGCSQSIILDIPNGGTVGCLGVNSIRPIAVLSSSLLSSYSSDGVPPLSDIDRLYRHPPIKWMDMDSEELASLEGKLFIQSGQLLDKLLRTREEEDSSLLATETINLGITATRLGGQKVQKPVIKDYYNPIEMTAMAGNRSDIIVLPNLKKTFSLSLASRSCNIISTSSSSSVDSIKNNNNNNDILGLIHAPPQSAPAQYFGNNTNDLTLWGPVGTRMSSTSRVNNTSSKFEMQNCTRCKSSPSHNQTSSRSGSRSRSRYGFDSGSRSGSGSVSPFRGGKGWAPGTSTLLFG